MCTGEEGPAVKVDVGSEGGVGEGGVAVNVGVGAGVCTGEEGVAVKVGVGSEGGVGEGGVAVNVGAGPDVCTGEEGPAVKVDVGSEGGVGEGGVAVNVGAGPDVCTGEEGPAVKVGSDGRAGEDGVTKGEEGGVTIVDVLVPVPLVGCVGEGGVDGDVVVKVGAGDVDESVPVCSANAFSRVCVALPPPVLGFTGDGVSVEGAVGTGDAGGVSDTTVFAELLKVDVASPPIPPKKVGASVLLPGVDDGTGDAGGVGDERGAGEGGPDLTGLLRLVVEPERPSPGRDDDDNVPSLFPLSALR